MRTLQNYIAGEWQVPSVEVDAAVCNASTNEVLFSQKNSSESQVEQAIRTASALYHSGEWGSLRDGEKADALDKFANALENRVDEIAEADSLCTGAILKFTRTVATICPAAFRAAATMLRQPTSDVPLAGPYGDILSERLPLGAAAIITPWNAPSGICAHKLASALAAGCPVIIKPSEWAPMSAQIIAEASEIAGLPSGLVQVVHGAGSIGAMLTSDDRIRAVSFTGGLQGGRAVAAACAQGIKPVQLELGGNNALVVLEDANLDAVADAVIAAMTTLNGQWCRALGRLIVAETVQETLLDKVRHRLANVVLGDSRDEESTMGPLVHKGHLAHVQSAVAAYQALGAELIQTTVLPDLEGNFFPPTLITGLRGEQALEEIFGPVATVHSFANEEEAIELANQTPFGLAAYVFGTEEKAWQVAKQIRAGVIKINDVTMLNLHALSPRPAWGLSGLGDEGGRETFEFFRGSRVIGVAARPEGAINE